MHADDPFRALHPGGERRDRERRRVRREDAAVVHDVLDALDELALRGEVLDDRLDDELRDADVRQRDDGRDPAERGVGLGTREAAFRHLPVERFGDAALRGVAGTDARVVQLDAVAVERGDLRDARAHRARADDGDDGILRQRGAIASARTAVRSALCAPSGGSERSERGGSS